MENIVSYPLDGKVKSPVELARIVSYLKEQGRRIVHCHGVFDLIHPGHIRHLEAARREGDVLIVTVTPDHYVNKGPGRPVFNQHMRAESLSALQCVDYVAINEWPTAVEIIQYLKPDIYAKGNEYAERENDITGKIYDEEQAIISVGGRLHFTDDVTFSSSHLINTHFSPFPAETERWLSEFRKRHSVDAVIQCLEGAASLKALVVGETILDEYVFCDGLGKATKDPILAFQYRKTETHAGGSLAVANHLAGFCEQVGLVTMLGESERREDFIRRELLPNVHPYFLTQRSSPTIHKRRFVDKHTGARIFELYLMNDSKLEAADEAALLKVLGGIVGEYDVVVVMDYGHGLLTVPTVDSLSNRSQFLAVNTQANAGNRGFNTISKYPRADYVCLTGQEVALETRLRHAGWRDLVTEVSKRISCPKFTVTLGPGGTIHFDLDYGFTEAPALATHVTDRMGAGDAVLAATSLLVALKTPWDVVGFVANLAGAQMVAALGTQTKVSRTSIAKHSLSLLK